MQFEGTRQDKLHAKLHASFVELPNIKKFQNDPITNLYYQLIYAEAATVQQHIKDLPPICFAWVMWFLFIASWDYTSDLRI